VSVFAVMLLFPIMRLYGLSINTIPSRFLSMTFSVTLLYEESSSVIPSSALFFMVFPFIVLLVEP